MPVVATSGPNTIVLKAKENHYTEIRATGTITPGHIMTRAGVVHPTADGPFEVLVARENAISSTNSGTQASTIDTNYVSGDLVFAAQLQPGDEWYGWLKAGVNAALDIPLASDGNGTFKLATMGTSRTWVRAAEAVDNSAGGAPVRIRLRATT